MKVARPDDVVPARAGRRRRRLRARRGRAPARGRDRGRRRLAGLVPALRARVRARDRREPPAQARGSRSLLPLFLASYARAARRAARGRRPRARALASVRAPGARDRASRSSSSSGAPTSSSPGVRRGSFALAPAASAARPLPVARRSPRTPARSARARCASSRAGVELPERGRASPRSRRTSSSSGASPRRRACASSLEATDGHAARRRRATGRCASACPTRSASSPPRAARPVLRAGGGRRLPLPARGLRRRRARGDGARPAGRRDGGRRPRSTRSRTASRASSCRRATPVALRVGHSSGSSATRAAARLGEAARGRRPAPSSRGTPRPGDHRGVPRATQLTDSCQEYADSDRNAVDVPSSRSSPCSRSPRAALPGAAGAAPGDLDPSFGERRHGDDRRSAAVARAHAVAILPNGKIVAAGVQRRLRARALSAGRHPRPGVRRRRQGDDRLRGLRWREGLAIQPNGRIVAVGEGGGNFPTAATSRSPGTSGTAVSIPPSAATER